MDPRLYERTGSPASAVRTSIGIALLAAAVLSAPAAKAQSAHPLPAMRPASEFQGSSFSGLIVSSSNRTHLRGTLGTPSKVEGNVEEWSGTPACQQHGLQFIRVRYQNNGLLDQIQLKPWQTMDLVSVILKLRLDAASNTQQNGPSTIYHHNSAGLALQVTNSMVDTFWMIQRRAEPRPPSGTLPGGSISPEPPGRQAEPALTDDFSLGVFETREEDKGLFGSPSSGGTTGPPPGMPPGPPPQGRAIDTATGMPIGPGSPSSGGTTGPPPGMPPGPPPQGRAIDTATGMPIGPGSPSSGGTTGPPPGMPPGPPPQGRAVDPATGMPIGPGARIDQVNAEVRSAVVAFCQAMQARDYEGVKRALTSDQASQVPPDFPAIKGFQVEDIQVRQSWATAVVSIREAPAPSQPSEFHMHLKLVPTGTRWLIDHIRLSVL